MLEISPIEKEIKENQEQMNTTIDEYEYGVIRLEKLVNILGDSKLYNIYNLEEGIKSIQFFDAK